MFSIPTVIFTFKTGFNKRQVPFNRVYCIFMWFGSRCPDFLVCLSPFLYHYGPGNTVATPWISFCRRPRLLINGDRKKCNPPHFLFCPSHLQEPNWQLEERGKDFCEWYTLHPKNGGWNGCKWEEKMWMNE